VARINRQASHQRCRHDWITGQPLCQRLGQFGGEAIIANRYRIIAGNQDKARGDPPPRILSRLLPQISIQRFDAAGEAGPIMPVRQGLDVKRRRGGSRSMTEELEITVGGGLEPGIRLPRIEERLRECPAVFGTQPDRLSFLDDAHGRVMHAGDHEIRERTPLQLGGALEQCLLIA
jgi:hypothetical protein